jgi:hypothetical protein
LHALDSFAANSLEVAANVRRLVLIHVRQTRVLREHVQLAALVLCCLTVLAVHACNDIAHVKVGRRLRLVKYVARPLRRTILMLDVNFHLQRSVREVPERVEHARRVRRR